MTRVQGRIRLPAIRGAGSFLLVLTLAISSAGADEAILPWLENLGARERKGEVHTITADAAVTVSDGLTYTVTTVYHGKRHAVFHRVYSDRFVTQGVEAEDVWSYDGDVETEAPPMIAQFPSL